MSGQAANAIRIPLPGGSTAEILSGSTRILHSDWLGSARVSSLYANRTVSYDTAYAPYSENYDGSSSDLNFTGQSQDTLSGLYDFLYREHNPVQGRWISPDRAGLGAVNMSNPQTWNRYAYVQNSPLNSVDPQGTMNYFPWLMSLGMTAAAYADLGVTEGFDFGSMWNEFAAMSIPVVAQNYVPPTSWSYTLHFFDSEGNDDPLYVFGLQTGYWQTTVVGSWGSTLLKSPWVVSWILPIYPVPVLGGIGPAGSLALNPKTKNVCLSIGVGASAGHNVAGGPIAGITLNGQAASPEQIDQILQGGSVNFGANVPLGPIPAGPGGQVSVNGSGAVYGPTFGAMGASLSSTYAGCAHY